jgi:hypothetical protein
MSALMIRQKVSAIMCAGNEGAVVQVRAAGKGLRAGLPAAVIAAALAGCSGFGGPKKDAAPTDPNAYPAQYRSQIATFLRQSLTNRADFRGAFISQPMLKPIGDSQRYMVCVQFHGNGQVKNKVAVYFAGMISQFIDSTPDQCGDAAYSPFNELAASMPPA